MLCLIIQGNNAEVFWIILVGIEIRRGCVIIPTEIKFFIKLLMMEMKCDYSRQL